ncbi:MAG TPA: zinc-ribbon domain-containing protein [Solirubrobacterales bacterium]|jgi:hypothetical protein|nr:zinc-ribbon domain-containing protein [Solirubrobacterales bacterium]
MTATGGADDPAAGGRTCLNCGQPLAPGAAFCRHCGSRYEQPANPPPPTPPRHRDQPRDPRRRRLAIWAAAAIVLVGAGAAVAILLSSGSGSSSTTVLVGSDETAAETDSTEAEAETAEDTTAAVGEGPAPDSVEAARYVQAGSFKTVSHAEAERERLAAAGIDVEVVPSDGAEQFYPGFQVLLGGPLEAGSEEGAMVKALRRNGVPSAFARGLTPALEVDGPEETAGLWSGTLDRSSGERPGLSGSLAVTLQMNADGEAGILEFEDSSCRDDLTLSETTTTTLAYAQSRSCAAAGDLLIRPSGGELMLSLLPPDSDVLVLGKLSPG